MDPATLSAIGFAANILQFIDYVSHILKIGKQIKRTGMSDFKFTIQESAKFLTDQANRIRPRPQIGEQALQDIAEKCITESRLLLDFIQKFERDRMNENGIKSALIKKVKEEAVTLATAIRISWKKAEINDLARRLDRYRSELHSEVLVSIRGTVISMVDQIDDLSTASISRHQELIVALARGNTNIQSSVERDSDNLSKQITTEIKYALQTTLLAVDEVAKAIQSRTLFPALPKSVTDYDPSLKTVAIHGGAHIEQKILELLNFRIRLHRQRGISETYQDTYSWIFCDPQQHQKSWSNFAEWLESGTGIYWIEGKAGCGKSTLMKYIATHAKTTDGLNRWAGHDQRNPPIDKPSKRMMTASYYFWLAGSQLEKDQEGLMRSLLHQILTARRDFISKAFPELYESLLYKTYFTNTNRNLFISCEQPDCLESFTQIQDLENHMKRHHETFVSQSGRRNQSDEETSGSLKLTELKEAFLSVSSQLGTDLKLCLFIDGLDEYSGDFQGLIDVLKRVVGNTVYLKIVASSRPENAFKQAFENGPTLRMHDLTIDDIKRYARGRLFEHKKLQAMRKENPNAAEELLVAVSSQASGVFLWVLIAVNNLLEGLTDGSTFTELIEMVYSYPKELRPFYEQMFSRVKEEYRLEAFKIYLAISHSRMIEGVTLNPLRLQYLLESPLKSLQVPFKILAHSDLVIIIRRISDRVGSRCRGLIQVHWSEDPTVDDIPEEGEIRLLHRTVSDFFDDAQDMMAAMTKCSGFDVDHYLAASILWSFKVRYYFKLATMQQWHEYLPTIRAYWRYCHQAGEDMGSDQTLYVQSMNEALNRYWSDRRKQSRHPFHAPSWIEVFIKAERITVYTVEKGFEKPDHILALATHYELEHYIQWRSSCLPQSSLIEDGGGNTVNAKPGTTSAAAPSSDESIANGSTPQGPAETQNLASKRREVKIKDGENNTQERRHQKLPKSPFPSGKDRDNKTCNRCQNLAKLISMDHSSDDALAAIDNNPDGADIRTLAEWLVRNPQTRIQQPVTERVPNHEMRTKAGPLQRQSKSSPWIVHNPRKGTRQSELNRVVGATPADPPLSLSGRGPRTNANDRRSEEKFSVVGEIELRCGKFSWFFDGKGTSVSQSGLAESQAKQLKQFLEQLLTEKA